MLLRLQRFEQRELDVTRLFHGISHPGLWVHIVEHRGNIADERIRQCLAAGRSTEGRRMVGVMLRGRAQLRTRASSRWVGPGGLCLCDARGDLSSRHEALDEPSLSMTIEWDRARFGGAPLGEPRLDQCDGAASIAALVDELRLRIERAWTGRSSKRDVAEQVVRMMTALRAEGLDVPSLVLADLESDLGPGVESLSRALDASLSLAGGRPMKIDLEDSTLVSARTVERKLPEVLRVWGQAPETFRELRSRVRLFQAQLLMSHPGATTELASRIFGFASPNALCKSFLKAGLPSPGRVREALAAAL